MGYVDPKIVYEVLKKAQEVVKRDQDKTLEDFAMLVEALSSLAFLRLKAMVESIPENLQTDIPLESKVFLAVDETLYWITRQLRTPNPLRMEIFNQTLKKALEEFRK